MEILQQQTLLFTEETSTSLQEDSHVSHSAYQEIKKENRMKDTYFLKCLEQHERLKPLGSWERTFMELLHQSFEKHSKKYVHRWKLRGTKYNRLLFQLLPLEHGMKGKGRGLLPTPTASDERGGRMASTQRVEKG